MRAAPGPSPSRRRASPRRTPAAWSARECELTLPADFTVERTGLWTIELTAESEAGETATDPIDLRVTPDTVDLLILGYALIFAIGIGFIATLAWRARGLRREARTLAALIDEEERERA
ncbi:MAG: hypothetical protein M5R40_25815 [Anaerolineae bacterium]|nr:hypothetical protein [Anaerolineae bacterium]